jgi:carbon-monoxide dehydrogenase medium subunit
MSAAAPEFDYVKPSGIAELVEGLRTAGGDGAVLAGGTDLHVKMRIGKLAPRVLFDISELGACRSIAERGDLLAIGAAVRMSEIIASPLIAHRVPALADAARQMSCRQIRNRATLGGNIVTASPAADAVPPLLAADATVLLAGPAGQRELTLANFLLGPGKTALEPGEVLTEILIPMQSAACRSGFVKVGRRKAQAISIINLCGSLSLDEAGAIRDLRLVLGSVGPTAMRARRCEQALQGVAPSKESLAAAAALAAEECRPITDLRGSAEGRRLLVEAWTLRLLTNLCVKGRVHV